MLGSNPVMIFLSATTDNGVGFCDWVAGVTSRDVYFIETRKRVVPLKQLSKPQPKQLILICRLTWVT